MSMPRKHTPRGRVESGASPEIIEDRFFLFPLSDKGSASVAGEAAVTLLSSLASESPAHYALFPLKKKLAQNTEGAHLLLELDGTLRLAGRVDKVKAPDHYGASARERWTTAGATEVAAWALLRDVRPISGAATEQLLTSNGEPLQLAPRLIEVKPKGTL